MSTGATCVPCSAKIHTMYEVYSGIQKNRTEGRGSVSRNPYIMQHSRYKGSVLLFSKLNKIIFGYFDSENILSDNEK